MTNQDKCDFCDSREVVRRYQCMDFIAESKKAGVIYDGTRDTLGRTNLALNSRNYWAACAPCASFIDMEDIEGLLKRVTEVLIDTPGGFSTFRRQQLIKHMRYMYELFFKNRIRVAG
jgi:hypothetical protein